MTNEKKGEREREREDTREITLNLTGCTPLPHPFSVLHSPLLMPLRVCEFPVASVTVVRDKNRARSKRESLARNKVLQDERFLRRTSN